MEFEMLRNSNKGPSVLPTTKHLVHMATSSCRSTPLEIQSLWIEDSEL